MMCICPRNWRKHRGDCPVELAFKSRCPECRSKKRDNGHIVHAHHCFFKGFDHAKPSQG